MAKHYSRYTPEMVSSITGIPVDQYMQVAKLVGEMGKPDKVMTIVYAVGLTHHTTGGQLIRSGALLQLILGNMGRPGGGMNAERGHANIQGNTDHAISWEILPGYLRIPGPGQKNLTDYVNVNAPKKSDPNSWNFFGTNYRNFMVSLLKAWYGSAATKDNEYAFDFIPKPGVNSSWMSIYDQALKGKMEGVMLSGMTATSIGPDSNQVMQALGKLKWLVVMDPLPTTSSELHNAARGSTGLKHDILVGLERRLKNLPSATDLVRPGLALTVKAFEGLIAVFFVLASAAYWIFERDRAVDLVCSLLPRPKRKTVRDTWTLIDLKLGAYVRGQGILVILVGTLLSLAFLVVGEPYWILVGAFAGLVEIVPVIGPLAAAALAIGVGLTDSLQTGVLAGVAVLVVRLMEDYVIMPRVLGEAVGLSPLLVLISVTAVGLLFGGFAVILAIPIVAVLTTLIDVVVRDKDPAEEEVPTVLFPAKEAET
jgi:hypothetical protein